MGKQDFGLEFFETLNLVAGSKLNEERVKALRGRLGEINSSLESFTNYLSAENFEVEIAEAEKAKIETQIGEFMADYGITKHFTAELGKKLGLGE